MEVQHNTSYFVFIENQYPPKNPSIIKMNQLLSYFPHVLNYEFLFFQYLHRESSNKYLINMIFEK